MFSIQFTYNGKPYTDLGDAIFASVKDQLAGIIEDKLAPFRHELDKAGAVVTIDLDDNYQGNVTITNVPDEIRQQVESALYS